MSNEEKISVLIELEKTLWDETLNLAEGYGIDDPITIQKTSMV